LSHFQRLDFGNILQRSYILLGLILGEL